MTAWSNSSVFPSLCLHGWPKTVQLCRYNQLFWETECWWTNDSLFQFNMKWKCYMSMGCSYIYLAVHLFQCVWGFLVMYACKYKYVLFGILIFCFESGDKINRLQQKRRGYTLLFVISSLESLLPLLKKKGSVQSTLFFMSNARQMWPTCGDSHCSLCASTVFCLIAFSSLTVLWHILG